MKLDWVMVALLIIITITLCYLMHEFYMRDLDECTRNPLTYAAKTMEERFDTPFIGSGFFIVEGESPIIIFNKDNASIKYPEKEEWRLIAPTINLTISD